jgi:hypothetical protein
MTRTGVLRSVLGGGVLALAVLAGLPGARAEREATTATSYGLEWPGTGTTRRMLYWANPHTNGLPIYDATYIFKVFPRKKDPGTCYPSGGNCSNRYWTTFFWGNNGTFTWDGGSANTYYGAHPYPVPPPNGTQMWEISVHAGDRTTGTEVQWNRWYTQAFVAWRVSSSQTEHRFYYDLPDTSKLLTVTVVGDPGWADQTPPVPAVVMGQAPALVPGSIQSWGGYPGWEEFSGVIRGIQIYNNDLTIADIQAEVVSPKSTTAGAASIWYLNLDPRPSDVTDKKAQGIAHNPTWDGTTALEWSATTTGPTPPPTPTGLRAN